MLKAKKWSLILMIAMLVTGSIFSSCNRDPQPIPEAKKEIPTKVRSETTVGSKEVRLQGSMAVFGKDVVLDIQDPFDSNYTYNPNLPVYAACSDAGRGNGFMNASAKSQWDAYKLNYDPEKQVFVLNQPVKPGQKPLMFTLCQVLSSENGATKILWLQLERYETSGYVYDNRPGPNRRIVFCGEGYQPETYNGKEIPLAFTSSGNPYPDLQLKATKN